ncbi:MAG TPA: NAD(P)-dependent oxidoreductase [Fimbriimonadaceae bacterium]|nr:NAD(P)-dependent oxidoreductase [Fimbriimonadaceae bacterium]
MDRLGFVGLGVMGAPMAGHLVRSGAQVTVWNRTPGRTAPLADAGAKVSNSLGELAQDSDVVFLCVSRSEDVLDCIQGLKVGLRAGHLIVDHSTIAPSVARQISEDLGKIGVGFVDAPITGGSMGAQAGTLTIFCGGQDAEVDRAIVACRPYTKRAERVGPCGAGQLMKLANQIAVGGALIGLCECLAFAKRAGLDLEQAKSMIGSGAGGSWAFENYGPKILNQDWSPGFSIKNQRKDFAYTKDAAKDLEAQVPGTSLVDELLAILESEGHGEWTTAALFEVLSR